MFCYGRTPLIVGRQCGGIERPGRMQAGVYRLTFYSKSGDKQIN